MATRQMQRLLDSSCVRCRRARVVAFWPESGLVAADGPIASLVCAWLPRPRVVCVCDSIAVATRRSPPAALQCGAKLKQDCAFPFESDDDCLACTRAHDEPYCNPRRAGALQANRRQSWILRLGSVMSTVPE